MTNNHDLRRAFDHYQRAGNFHPDAEKDTITRPGGGTLTRFRRQPPRMSFIAYSRLDPADLDDAIAQQVADLRAHHRPFEWLVMDHDTPPNLPERLRAHGFDNEGEESPILVLDLDEAPGALRAPVQADVRPITTRAGLEDVIAVLEGVYGGSYAWVRERLGLHLEIPGYLSVYAAYVDDRPVAAAWTYFNPAGPFAGLWGGATLAEFRGRGLYTALLAVRAQEAARRARRWVYLDASEMSQPIVKKLGFQVLGMLSAYEWTPPE